MKPTYQHHRSIRRRRPLQVSTLRSEERRSFAKAMQPWRRSRVAAWMLATSVLISLGMHPPILRAEETSFQQFLDNAARNMAEANRRDSLQPETPLATESTPLSSSSTDTLALPPEPTEVTTAVDTIAPWWESIAFSGLLQTPEQVSFDLPTVLTDTLETSPRISSVSRRTSIAYEKIVQQNAVFDPTLLLEGGYGRVNDPVGSTLTTGGPDRLIQNSVIASGGFRKLTRRGAVVDVTQELGTLDSNSLFFEPNPQGNSRVSLSITQPLLATSGEVYNTRLVTQASIDSRIAWQEMRSEVEAHLVDTFQAFWRLYERRCHLVQQRGLIERGEQIARIVDGRADLDSGPLQRIKVQRRLANDRDRQIEIEAELRRLQVRLRTLVGSPELAALNQSVELIPLANPEIPNEAIDLQDAIVRGLENRPDIQAATQELAAAGLGISVTRNELKPRLDAVFDAYLSGLRGDNRFFQAFGDQFTEGPGLTATLQYSLPYGRRAARSRVREARYRYQQRSEELRQSLLTARREIETALIQAFANFQLRESKAITLQAAIREEQIATRRWELLAGDGGPTALVLEDLLETQKRRTESEQLFVSAQVASVISLIELQKAMGTLLKTEGIEPVRPDNTSQIELLQTNPADSNASRITAHQSDWNSQVVGESLIGELGMIELDDSSIKEVASDSEGSNRKE
ncbi:outer membrane channel protein [Rhodopirellula bahusiensis]|uniref:Outer membrane channel protein n=2 Tax=Rhodopirellula bahusiensis TaxID=2014065 RepID=A0A2G1WBV3_9BACT|nr:outer membrane channel protein [Rhodopirellula bahusiensis]